MIVKNSKKEKNTVTFDVELDAAEFEKYVNGAYLKARSRIMVPGFRKGKAPRMVIEGMYGKDVFYDDAFDNAANDAFAFGVAEGKLETVGRPTMTDSKVTEENGALLSFSTDVYPEVTLGQYKGLEAEKPSVEVTDEEVDGHIERLRKQNARLITVERPAQDGDTVNINYAGMLDGIPFDGGTAENQNLVLGSNTFVPGFESQLVGISAGEERDLDITFPENYGHDLGGKAVVFHVKCNEVKFEELPELDDEFAKDNDFDTLADLKADIRAKSVEEKEKAAKNAFDDALVDQAVENMTVDMPEGMIEERMDGIVREYAQYMANQGIRIDDYLKMIGTDMKTFRESMRATAEKQARTEVLLAAVAEAENVQISEEDLQAEYEKLGEAYGMKAEDLQMIPIYCGVKGEEEAGLCSGTENCWAVNAEASEADIQATLDFMKWVVTSEEGTTMLAEQFGPCPFNAAKTPANVFFADANALTTEGKYVVTWAFNYTPAVDDWRAAVVARAGCDGPACGPALITPARRIRENGRRKGLSCLPPRGQFAATFLVQTKKSRRRAIYHQCQECAQQCRHHWRPQTRQRPIAHVFARQSPAPRVHAPVFHRESAK